MRSCSTIFGPNRPGCVASRQIICFKSKSYGRLPPPRFSPVPIHCHAMLCKLPWIRLLWFPGNLAELGQGTTECLAFGQSLKSIQRGPPMSRLHWWPQRSDLPVFAFKTPATHAPVRSDRTGHICRHLSVGLPSLDALGEPQEQSRIRPCLQVQGQTILREELGLWVIMRQEVATTLR